MDQCTIGDFDHDSADITGTRSWTGKPHDKAESSIMAQANVAMGLRELCLIMPFSAEALGGKICAVCIRAPIGLLAPLRGSTQPSDDSPPSSDVFYAFDILHLNGWDLRKCDLIERKRVLEGAHRWSGYLRFTEHVDWDPALLLAEARRLKLEGIIVKRADAAGQSNGYGRKSSPRSASPLGPAKGVSAIPSTSPARR